MKISRRVAGRMILGVPLIAAGTGLAGTLVQKARADEPQACLDRGEVLAAAPSAEAGQFRVPPVLGEAP